MTASADAKALLGRDAAGGRFAVDVSELPGAHMALIANSGSGKSRSLRKILEVTHGRLQHIVLDDEGEFYTLRERFDYVIAGGSAGDCPATPDNASALALALLENGLSAIVQVGALKSAHDRQLFVARFLTALLEAPEELWHPVLVVIDEAQRFVPQDGKTESGAAVEEFAASARKRGFSLVVSTGRFSKISTNVRAHCVNWLVGRPGGTIDRQAAARELGFPSSSAEARGLKDLGKGQFWAVGPAFSAEPHLVQFGEVVTTHLERGQVRVPTPPAPAKLRKIMASLAVVAKVEAQAKADDPKALRAEVARLSAELARKSAAAGADPAEVKAAEQRGFAAGVAEGDRRVRLLGKGIERFVTSLKTIERMEEGLADFRAKSIELLTAPIPEGLPAPAVPSQTAAKSPRTGATPAKLPAPASAPGGNVAQPPARQRVLDVLAWFNAIGVDPVPRNQACVMIGLSPKASTFGVYVSSLTSAGLIEVAGPGLLSLTAEGRRHAAAAVLGTGSDAIVAAARAQLEPAAARVFDIIVRSYPDPVERGAIADELGLSRQASTLGVYITKLTARGFVEVAGRGTVRAASFLLPGGA